ncbi:MAG: OmpP1/FadL family transporter [Flavobacteriales bacterium]
MNKRWIGLVLWSISLTFLGQNEEDIFRYSYLEALGSARSMGMGGAFGALGADLSCTTGNPAGLGFYRRGDLGITTGFASQKTKLRIKNQLGSGNKLSGATTNLGIALSYPSVNPDWPVSTLALTYTKRANYDQSISSEEVIFESSLLDVFLGQAQGYQQEDLLNSTFQATSGLAWEAYLLDPHPNNNPTEYISAIPGGGVNTIKTIERTGDLSEMNIAFGTGLLETLYMGVTLGIVGVDFTEETTHQETPMLDSLDLSQWKFREDLNISGSGLNLKVGVIATATSWLRLGLAYHSRTFLSLTEEYSTGIESNFKNGDRYEQFSLLNRTEYIINTPSRWMASAAFILGKSGVVSADYEYVNYANGQLKPTSLADSDAYDFAAENENLNVAYGSSHIARVGAEFRIQRAWRVRLGVGMETSPYTDAAQVSADATRYTASTGWGYRSEKWYGSMTYRRSWREQDLSLFSHDLIEVGKLGNTHGMVVFAVGFRL